MTPFFASAVPSYRGTDPPPSVNAPPNHQIITGRFSVADAAPVHTLRYRQSSLVGGEPSMFAMLSRPWPGGWMQTLPYLLASRTPLHFATGCGAVQRSAPTGGAANGMPLNARMPGADSTLPPSSPESSFRGSLSAACADQETMAPSAAVSARAPT